MSASLFSSSAPPIAVATPHPAAAVPAVEPFSHAFAVRFMLAYWRSNARWPGVLLIAMLLGLQALSPWLIYWQNGLNKSFFDSLTGRDLAVVEQQIAALGLMFVVTALSAVSSAYLRDVLLMVWRRWQTVHLLDRWLGPTRAFARIERENLVENADQRIAEDAGTALRLSYGIVFGLVGAVVGLATYGGLLWAQSRPVTLPLGDAGLTVPHLLFWAAFVYAALSVAITHLGGHRLSPTEAMQQRVEAMFRFLLVRTREHSEQIGFYRGEASENGRLDRSFDQVRANWWPLLRRRTVVATIYDVFNGLSSLLPTLVMAPLIATDRATLGDMTQVEWTYLFFVAHLLWFSSAYGQLAQWTAAHRRLYTLERGFEATDPAGIERVVGDGTSAITAQNLQLRTPAGRPLAEVGSFEISPGERLLLRGPSGAGKSTLLRALAGLWPHGRGRVQLPAGVPVMFLPQRSYLPQGTLKAALSYPRAPDAFGDSACIDALGCFGLAHLAPQLAEHAPWSQRLSPGEQQRVAAARVLLQRPQVLIVDEATSALDATSGHNVYRVLIDRLPGLTLLSVAHDASLATYHDRVLELVPAAGAASGAV